MADLNPVGIDLMTGQNRPITIGDVPTDSGGTELIGYSGLSGDTGIMGETGTQGPQGYSGYHGNTGPSVLGLQGLTGIQGETGIRSATGITGRSGLVGSTGPTGNTGVIGITGFQGRGNYALLFGTTTINATVPTGGPYIIGITGGGFTVTLPLAASLGTREIIIQDEMGFSATSATTFATTGADTINGAGTISLNKNFAAIKLVSDGVSVFIARNIVQGNTGSLGQTGVDGSTGI